MKKKKTEMSFYVFYSSQHLYSVEEIRGERFTLLGATFFLILDFWKTM